MSGLDLYLSQRTLALMFVYASLVGFGLGGVYDGLRILRMLCGDTAERRGRSPSSGKPVSPRSVLLTVLLFLEDVLFAFTAVVTLILLCYYTNDGQLRAPAVIGMACGFFVYIHTLGRLVMGLAERLVRLIKRAAGFCLGLLLLPLKGLISLIRSLWSLTVGRIAAARRERVTEEQIQALTKSASRGFGMAEEEPLDHEKT